MIIIRCSGGDGLECSGMFHIPGFIGAHSDVARKFNVSERSAKICYKRGNWPSDKKGA